MNLNGIAYSQLISNLQPGLTPTITVEQMGTPRIEGVAVVLPDGTVFLCCGAQQGGCQSPWQ